MSGRQLSQTRPLAALGRFVNRPAQTSTHEVCEMCASEIAPGHSHIVNIESRSLMCACRACYLLFTQQGAAQGKYKAVPDRYLMLSSFELTPETWEEFQIPVGMAFFFFNSALKRVTGFYPSPAGATESMLTLEAWQNLAAGNPTLATLEQDVEALLINRPRGGNFECFVVPIDACYELTGIVRRRWKGFDGGEEARRDIDAFFDSLRAKCRLGSLENRMSEIDFQVLDAKPQPYAAIPTLAFRLRIEEPSGAAIHSISLHCQIRIEPQRRRYSKAEEECLRELFGATSQWGDTLKPFLWTHVDMMVRGFEGGSEIDLHVPCSYDFEVGAAKYLHSLGDGEIPLLFLFNGTVFAKAPTGLSVSQLAWHKDATYRLPVRIWRDLMDLYFPNSGWLRLRRDTIDELLKFKARCALATWDQVFEVLLKGAGEKAA